MAKEPQEDRQRAMESLTGQSSAVDWNDLPAAAVDKLAGIESPRRSLTVEKLSGFPLAGVCERVSTVSSRLRFDALLGQGGVRLSGSASSSCPSTPICTDSIGLQCKKNKACSPPTQPELRLFLQAVGEPR